MKRYPLLLLHQGEDEYKHNTILKIPFHKKSSALRIDKTNWALVDVGFRGLTLPTVMSLVFCALDIIHSINISGRVKILRSSVPPSDILHSPGDIVGNRDRWYVLTLCILPGRWNSSLLKFRQHWTTDQSKNPGLISLCSQLYRGTVHLSGVGVNKVWPGYPEKQGTLSHWAHT